MTRTPVLIVSQLIAATIGATTAVLFRLDFMFARAGNTLDAALLVSFVVIVVSAGCGIAAALGGDARRRRFATAAAAFISMLAGFIVPAVNVALTSAAQHERTVEDRRVDTDFIARLENYERDIDARIAQQRVFAPAEALAFVNFADGSDLSYRSLPDYSARAFALLSRALAAKVVDPNVRVKGPRPVDVAFEPLFIQYYKIHIQPARNAVERRRWQLLLLLVDAGADLGADGAAPIVEDLPRARALAL